MTQFEFKSTLYSSMLLLFTIFLVSCGDDDDDTTPPGEVSSFTATAGEGDVLLTWAAPTDTDLKSFLLDYSPDGSPLTLEKTVSTTTISDLTNGTEYTFTLKTEDNDGNQSEGVQAQARPLLNELFADDFDSRCNVPFGQDPEWDPWIIHSVITENGDDASWFCGSIPDLGGELPTEYKVFMDNQGYEFPGFTFNPIPGNDWLILPLTLPENTDYSLHFSYEITGMDLDNYGLKLRTSVDYGGSGDPTTATWTDINVDFVYTVDENSAGIKMAQVPLADFGGTTVYIAFHYTSSGNTAETSYVVNLDEISVRLTDN